jgi:hypothetical protein
MRALNHSCLAPSRPGKMYSWHTVILERAKYRIPWTVVLTKMVVRRIHLNPHGHRVVGNSFYRMVAFGDPSSVLSPLIRMYYSPVRFNAPPEKNYVKHSRFRRGTFPCVWLLRKPSPYS